MEASYKCEMCHSQFTLLNSLVTHYKNHEHQADFMVTCQGVQDCLKLYSNLNSYRNHLRKNHGDTFKFTEKAFSSNASFLTDESDTSLLDSSIKTEESVMEHESYNDNSLSVTSIDTDQIPEEGDVMTHEMFHVQGSTESVNLLAPGNLPSDDSDSDSAVSNQVHYLKENIALDLLKYREKNKVTTIATQQTAAMCGNIAEYSRQDVMRQVLRILEDNDVLTPDIEQQINNIKTDVEASCADFEKPNHFDRYIQKQFDINMGKDIKFPNQSSMSHVKIHDSLRYLLSFHDVISEVMQGHALETGFIGDLVDTEWFKEHPVFGNNPKALILMLYADEFTSVNPMRSRAKKHKLLASYLMLGNLAPDYRCRQAGIQLVDMMKSKDAKEYGLPEVLKETIADLIDLTQNGITITHEGEEIHFECGLYLILGDNLGQHQLGGFAECFIAARVCRFCDIEFWVLRRGGVGIPRNPAAHDAQVRLIERDDTMCAVYGVYKSSPFNVFEGFHVSTSLPSCAAHDMFEGASLWLMEELIHYCLRERFFTMAILNRAINNFPYEGSDKRDKPSPVSGKPTAIICKQSFAQMYALTRLFPLLIGNHVPEDNAKWEVLLTFLRAQEFILAPILRDGEEVVMGEIIEEFLQLWSAEFGRNEKPKHHYMRHYEEQFRKFGPVRNYWTMHLEQKHDVFLRIMKLCQNTRNIPKTMTYRHQCQWLVNSGNLQLFPDEIKVINAKALDVNELPDTYRDAVKSVNPVGQVTLGKAVMVNSTRFGVGCALAYSTPTQSIAFDEILHGVQIHNEAYVVVVEMDMIQYHRHYIAYEVKQSDRYKFKRIKTIPDKYPLGIYTLPGRQDTRVVVLKHKILQ